MEAVNLLVGIKSLGRAITRACSNGSTGTFRIPTYHPSASGCFAVYAAPDESVEINDHLIALSRAATAFYGELVKDPGAVWDMTIEYKKASDPALARYL